METDTREQTETTVNLPADQLANLYEGKQSERKPQCRNSDIETAKAHPFAKYLPNLDASKFPKIHPHANIFPMMELAELQELAKSIKANGQRELIWTDSQGRIVDGRNRWVACTLAGVKPVLHSSPIVKDDDFILDYVYDHNFHRRHLTTSQKAAVAADFVTATRGGRNTNEMTAQQVADKFGVSRDSVQDAKKLKAEAPDLHEEVKAGKRRLHKATKKAGNKKAKKKKFAVAQTAEGKWYVCAARSSDVSKGNAFETEAQAQAEAASRNQQQQSTESQARLDVFLEDDEESKACGRWRIADLFQGVFLDKDFATEAEALAEVERVIAKEANKSTEPAEERYSLGDDSDGYSIIETLDTDNYKFHFYFGDADSCQRAVDALNGGMTLKELESKLELAPESEEQGEMPWHRWKDQPPTEAQLTKSASQLPTDAIEDETRLEEVYNEMQDSFIEWRSQWEERICKAEDLTGEERIFAHDTVGEYDHEFSTAMQENVVRLFEEWLARWGDNQAAVAGMLITHILTTAHAYDAEQTAEVVKNWSKEKNKKN